jgi:hypothetical protein
MTLNNMNQQMTTIAAGIKDLPALLAASLASAQPAASSSTSDSKLRIVLLPQLERAKYPGIKNWFQDPYLKKRKKGKAKLEEDEDPADFDESEGKVSITSLYMEDENGEQLPEAEKVAARTKARSFWNELLKAKEAPPSLGVIGLDIKDRYIWIMENAFPWLRLCSNHWKSEQIWRNHYHWGQGGIYPVGPL